MSLVGATAPSEVPQTGVKRTLQGNPTTVPNNLPAFRGRPVVAPERDIKVPKLSQGNRPNEGTNVAIPYNRICPLEFLSGWTGRLAPGDVAFVLKYPPGFLSKNPMSAGTNGTATMSRVIGLDGVNRLLHGEGNPDGWVAGANVLVLDGPDASPLEVLNGADDSNGPFKGLSLLDAIRLDGVVKSNDEPYAFTSSGSRDAVVFNNVIQGPTIVNNGFLLYDSRGNPGYGATNGPTSGATPLRTVEAYPRGSIEGGYHIGGAGNQVGYPSRVGSGWLDGNRSQYDYVATFTGTYSTYPAQMFDRNVQPMNTLYLGLRAYKMSPEMMAKVRADADEAEGSAGLEGSGKVAYFFQIVPFSSRKAYLCQHVQDILSAEKDKLMEEEMDKVSTEFPNATLALVRKEAGERIATTNKEKASAIKEALQKKLIGINATMASHKHGEKKSRFDDDVFDAVRTEDLANMVGAWKLGHVLDVKAMRKPYYEGGPADSSFALTVDVQMSWRNALPRAGGAVSNGVVDSDFLVSDLNDVDEMPRQYVEYGTNTVDRNGRTFDVDDNNGYKDQLAIDTYNAQFPSMRASLGNVFGSRLYSLYTNDVRRARSAASPTTNLPGTNRSQPSYVGASAWAAPDALLSVAVDAPVAAPTAAAPPAAAPTAVAPPAAAPIAVAPPVAPSPAAAPTAMTPAAAAGAPIVAAAMAAAAARPRASSGPARGKSPSRPARSASTAAPASTAPVAAPAPQAGAPRRRERGGAQTSTVASVFDTIFGPADPTSAAGEPPASPTPSSGSDVSASGPKTFRRPR